MTCTTCQDGTVAGRKKRLFLLPLRRESPPFNGQLKKKKRKSPIGSREKGGRLFSSQWE